ncbi:MAG: hypothetical protein HYY18_05550 [Planctomycetes bacterium]|nr:hypothetical protein [Planctomycetota bacterium]
MKRAAVVLLTFAMAACDKIKEVPNPLGGPSGGQASGEASPGTTVDSYRAAIAAQDWQQLYGLLSVEFQQQAVGEVEKLKRELATGTEAEKKAATARVGAMGMTPAEFQKTDSKTLAALWIGAEVKAGSLRLPKEIAEVRAIKLENERAEVTYARPGGGQGTLKFVKQNGAWRFAP